LRICDKYAPGDVALAIAGGKGWLYEETLELVEKLNLRSHVHFLGRVSGEALHQLYVAARCHIHPAHYGDLYPPLETMACENTLHCQQYKQLPEVVGDAALLVDPGDPEEMAVAMQRLLNDDELHAELRAKGLQRARVFSWERAAHRTLDVYRKVAEPRRASSQQPAATTPEKGL
jgi:glycosyltransferase involved in cell wall biosynthesis